MKFELKDLCNVWGIKAVAFLFSREEGVYTSAKYNLKLSDEECLLFYSNLEKSAFCKGKNIFKLAHAASSSIDPGLRGVWILGTFFLQGHGQCQLLARTIHKEQNAKIYKKFSNKYFGFSIKTFAVNIAAREAKEPDAHRLKSFFSRNSTTSPFFPDIHRACSSLFGLAKSLFPVDLFYIGLPYHDQRVRLCFVVDSGKKYPPVTLKVTTHILEQVIQQKRNLLIHRSTEEAHRQFVNNNSAIIGDKTRMPKAVLASPLFFPGQGCGIVSMQSYAPNQYDTEDFNAFKLFAHHAAMTIQSTFASVFHTNMEKANQLCEQFEKENPGFPSLAALMEALLPSLNKYFSGADHVLLVRDKSASCWRSLRELTTDTGNEILDQLISDKKLNDSHLGQLIKKNMPTLISNSQIASDVLELSHLTRGETLAIPLMLQKELHCVLMVNSRMDYYTWQGQGRWYQFILLKLAAHYCRRFGFDRRSIKTNSTIDRAGLMHELNQPLTGITGLISLILEDSSRNDVNYENLKEIENQAFRLRDYIQGILDKN